MVERETNEQLFSPMLVYRFFCNKQHIHAPWAPTVVNGRAIFPTHSEAAYPEVLCQRIASLLKHEMLRHGAIEIANLPQQGRSQGKSLDRVVLGSLPRGKHVKPLVSEYGAYLQVINAVQSDDMLHRFLDSMPKGAVIQSRLLTTRGEVRDAVAKQIKKKTSWRRSWNS